MISWWRGASAPSRVLAIVATVGCAVALTTAGLVAWLIADPEYWLPGAYAEKGERGDPGPRGPRGPRGRPGPVGPSARDALDDLELRLSATEDTVYYLTELERSVQKLESRLVDVEDNVVTLCRNAEDTFEDTDLFSYISLGCPLY